MKRHVITYTAAVMTLSAVILAASPCQAQFLKQIEQGLLGGQGQGQQQGAMFGHQPGAMYGQQSGANLVGNVNLPPAQYMMTNVQTGQAFYVVVQNGQMFLTGQPGAGQTMAPGGMMQGQQGGLGGLGSFLKNELAPQQGQQQLQQQIPNQ